VRFLFDENMTVNLPGNISAVAPWHDFQHVNEVGLRETPDVELLPRAAALGFHAIITDDRRQLVVEHEREAIRTSGLTWITLRRTNAKGLPGIAAESASLIAALPHIVSVITESQTPRLIRVKGVGRDAGQRITVFNL
jgi:hypothetical protein